MKKAPILPTAVLTALAAAWIVLFAVGARSASTDKSSAAPADSGANSTNPEAGKQQPTPAPPAEQGEPVDMTAGELLRAAREKLHGYRTVKSNLIETVVVGDRKFRAAGTYLQGEGLKLKLSLQLSLGRGGRFKASMLQVCDGQVLWTSHRFGRPEDKSSDDSQDESSIEQRITRRDVRQILREAARYQQLPAAVLFAELGMGGLYELLGSLEQSMAYGKVRNEQIDGKPFLVVQGRWNLEVLEHFLDEKELEKLRTSDDARLLPRLPEHVPDMVRLYFARDSLFPRRILYLKRPEGTNSLQPMLSLNFVDVVLNAAIDEKEFHFVPPDEVYPTDVTPKYIKEIRSIARAAGAD